MVMGDCINCICYHCNWYTNLLNKDGYREVQCLIYLESSLNSTQLHVKIDDTTPKIYAIKGSSGIGKTTILNMLAIYSNQTSVYTD